MKGSSLFILTTIFFAFTLLFQPNAVVAQCAMCSLNAENSTQGENTQGKGLNDGILFLLSIPFIVGAGVGLLWYKKYRNKEERVSPFQH
ncbi:hypothetical protein [Sphingobacterium pedocola]|uniref:hypothetical protein n=1 Tax=Sphingobacterium pedocola TaxID=2082722 RepID=UPI0018CAE64C|nr:hypothetical protein [Sphingobacterium pedocola]